MNIDFELILTLSALVTGIVVFINKMWLAPARALREVNAQEPLVIEYSKSFFPILLAVLLLRTFIIEPFRIPSGSLKPTLQVGDFVAVSKFSYGLRLPVIHTKILKTGEPKVGDIVVFRWPPDPKLDYIKRIVGTPGDKISYVNKLVTLNGVPAMQEYTGQTYDHDTGLDAWPVDIKQENLAGHVHGIYERPDMSPTNFYDLIVPENSYFAMGDNRDDSSDSRVWGFVPEQNVAGKAFIIWFSWDNENHRVRWERIGKRIA